MGSTAIHRSAALRALAWILAGFVLVAGLLLMGELSTPTYRKLISFGQVVPGWLADVMILILISCFVLGLWAAGRSPGCGRLALGLSGGVGVVVAYGASEAFKILIGQDRPCRTILAVVECPPVGDWSFPSNHATIAFAVATATVLMVRRRWVGVVYGLAALTAAARVVEGVHYPHDVVAGALVGTCTVVACTT
ncbi:phosphatase PAP2 family protein, partial [Kocuria rosea]|uniref:phosphatase PAP2 family protein n=1 Tax=Kocuria rosea TaxID=1275 RepID=UPI00203F60A7|nr:phosphatase PAP2 family protein [Kocuria rosea]